MVILRAFATRKQARLVLFRQDREAPVLVRVHSSWE
jgi:hypothetical protein